MGNFRIGAEPHPGAVVDPVNPKLDPVVGRNGPASNELVAKPRCLGPTRLGLGFFLCIHLRGGWLDENHHTQPIHQCVTWC